MRLELGSGGRPQAGWTHLDIRPDVGADIVDDATVLSKIPDGSCEAIRAAHILEHFSWRDTDRILQLWRSKLAKGGRLDIEVPNLTGHIRNWRSALSTDSSFIEALYGEQDYEHNYHRTGFTADTLHTALDQAGFSLVFVNDIGCVLIGQARR